MSSEVRGVLNQVIPVINSIRDTQISLMGTEVIFKVPVGGKPVFTMYGDIDKTVTTENLVTQIVIKWGPFRALINNLDTSAEDNLPLEVYSKLKDRIPKGSTVDLTYINQDNIEVVRTFEVIGVEDILEINEIGRKLTLVPKRS